jgi:hypothetical protein
VYSWCNVVNGRFFNLFQVAYDAAGAVERRAAHDRQKQAELLAQKETEMAEKMAQSGSVEQQLGAKVRGVKQRTFCMARRQTMITMGSPYFVWKNAYEIISSLCLLGAVCAPPPPPRSSACSTSWPRSPSASRSPPSWRPV